MKCRDVGEKLSHAMVHEPLALCSSKGPLETSLVESNSDDANSQSRTSHTRCLRLIAQDSSSTFAKATHATRNCWSGLKRRRTMLHGNRSCSAMTTRRSRGRSQF